MTGCRCGFDWEADGGAVVAGLRSLPDEVRRAVAAVVASEGGTRRCRRRPAPGVWSVVEYTAHTRDALLWYGDRIDRVLAEDRPVLAPCDWDRACAERGYAEEDPDAAVAGLAAAAVELAGRLDRLDPGSWDRVGVGSTGAARRLLDLARRAGHEGRHHLDDIRRVATLVRAASPTAGE